MAWELWKEVLVPGRFRDRHGDWFAYSPRQIAQAARNVGRMLSRGVPIPCIWEHVGVEANSPDDVKARYAKHTFGHVAGRRINGRGALELLHRGTDVRDRDQLLKTRFVSPKVYPGYSDSRGGEYRGPTVAHVAATPTPVQWTQRPFELSRGKALFLSYTPEDAMADDADTGKKGGDDEGAGKKGGSGGGATSGGKKTIADVIEALRSIGMNIPDEATDEAGLIIAIKAGGSAGLDDDGGDDLDDLTGGASGTTAAGGGAPMLMSDARAEPLRRHSRKEATARVKALFASGRVDKPTAQRLLREVQAVELSFTRDGEMVSNKLWTKIEVLEDMPANSAWKATGHADGRELSTTTVDAPEQLTGKGDPKKITDFMCAGLPAKK